MTKKKGRKFTKLEQDTGMLEEHMLAIAIMCIANDTIVAFRPINPDVKVKFSEGCVGKGMDIKAKSSDQGVLGGLIPVNQEFSKLGTNNDFEFIKKYKKLSDTKISTDKAKYEDIKKQDGNKLTGKELRDFKNSCNNLVKAIPATDSNGKQIYGFLDKVGHAFKNEKNEMLFVTQKTDGEYVQIKGGEIAVPDGYSASPIEVYAYLNIKRVNNESEETASPVTADYDQLFVGTKAENKGKAVQIRDNDYAGFATGIGHAVTAVLAVDTKDKLAISHGQETGNPSPEHLDGKFVIFVPSQGHSDIKHYSKEYLLSHVKIADTEQELINFYNEKKKEGYSIPINPRWGWKLEKNGDFSINPKRISAQFLDLANSKFQNTDAEEEAERLSDFYMTLAKKYLESEGCVHDLILAKEEQILRNLETNFSKKYNTQSPTSRARIQTEDKEELDNLESKRNKEELDNLESECNTLGVRGGMIEQCWSMAGEGLQHVRALMFGRQEEVRGGGGR